MWVRSTNEGFCREENEKDGVSDSYRNVLWFLHEQCVMVATGIILCDSYGNVVMIFLQGH